LPHDAAFKKRAKEESEKEFKTDGPVTSVWNGSATRGNTHVTSNRSANGQSAHVEKAKGKKEQKDTPADSNEYRHRA
jgi:hypothetical protein